MDRIYISIIRNWYTHSIIIVTALAREKCNKTTKHTNWYWNQLNNFSQGNGKSHSNNKFLRRLSHFKLNNFSTIKLRNWRMENFSEHKKMATKAFHYFFDIFKTKKAVDVPYNISSRWKAHILLNYTITIPKFYLYPSSLSLISKKHQKASLCSTPSINILSTFYFRLDNKLLPKN